MKFQLPNNTEHVSVIGQNGSGKTQLAAWLLSRVNFDKQPWIIVDYKRDELINKIPRIQELSIKARIPTQPGLYIVHPAPYETNEIEDFLWRVWAQERTGVYFDEAHMIPIQEKGAFQALLTQGRSKRIPLIVLTQRPSWVSRFVFSEAKYFSVFYLNDVRDRKIVEAFVPVRLDFDLPRYNSHWYDTGQRKLFRLQPVPSGSTILSFFDKRIPERKSWFW